MMTSAQLIAVTEWLLIALGAILIALLLIRGRFSKLSDGFLLGIAIQAIVIPGLLLMTKWPS